MVGLHELYGFTSPCVIMLRQVLPCNMPMSQLFIAYWKLVLTVSRIQCKYVRTQPFILWENINNSTVSLPFERLWRFHFKIIKIMIYVPWPCKQSWCLVFDHEVFSFGNTFTFRVINKAQFFNHMPIVPNCCCLKQNRKLKIITGVHSRYKGYLNVKIYWHSLSNAWFTPGQW